MTEPDDYIVTVCADCLCASCWHGEYMCQSARSAGLAEKRASELALLGREHPDHFGRDKVATVTGVRPR